MKLGILASLLMVLSSQAMASRSNDKALVEKKEDLEKTKKKIQSQKQQLDALQGKESSIMKKLSQIDQRKATLQDQKGTLQKNIKAIDSELDRTSMTLDQRKQMIQQHSNAVAKQLRDLYMYGEMNYLKIFLASASFDDLNQKQFLVKRWVDRDQKKITNFQEEALNLKVEKGSLEEKKSKKTQDLGDLQKTEQQILDERQSKKKLLTMVKTQKEYYKKSIDELEQASKNLESLILQFKKTKPSKSSEPSSSSRFAQMRGRLLLPVQGPIEKKYGPYEDTKLHVNLYQKGIDIRAKEGTEVNAVFDGKVAYADWFSGYGKVVILDHDNGYFTLYAHLSKIDVEMGQSVTIGDNVGEVGDTESLKGDYLYFELREKGVTVNPLPWFDR